MTIPTDDAPKHTQTQIAERTSGLMAQIADDVRKSKVGRKTKRTPELINDLLLYLRAGLSLEDAGRQVGVCNETIHNWKRADPDLSADIEQARDDGMETLEAAIINIMSGGSLSTGSVNRDKALVHELRWIMSKRNARYRDKVEVNQTVTTYTIQANPKSLAMFDQPLIEGDFIDVDAVMIEDQSEE
ncbi:hypothetical protein JQK15_13485 [Sphingobium sp. BHU LFT2]|uniref:terminase small subunit-like protein n=1 Tax=Sphingobium sp. BHU LFT2 TaxID=2807634 RepID=UPI001BE763B3|nr:hypothetical protein [Sphingobium sp. BHU LFT2]MBT2244551.1 hypothetical protein [Sphingobium sp. BHU LFT2]